MPSVGQKRRKQEAARKIDASRAENEIAPMPPIQDVARRIESQRDPVLWLKTYLPEVFFAEFSESQTRFVRTCWATIQANGSKNIEAYRGFGKTSILSGLLLMCLLTGRIRHAVYFVAEGGRMTKQASNWFQKALYEDYDKPAKDAKPLVADYPEACYPLQRRRGVANKPLTYRGEPCEIIISPDKIQFPTIAGSPSSGSLLTFASVNSSVRGASHHIRGEGPFRVGAVLFDDIQTDATATSVKETDAIVSTIKSSIGFLSGKTKDGGKEPLIVLSAITQNRPGDVAERIRTENPELNTTTIPFLRSVPSDFDAWRKYRERRMDIYRANNEEPEKARALINEYYQANRDEIERDVIADDPRIFEPGQISAIQYAVEKWCASERSFWCELQNDAARGAQEEDGGLAPITVFRKRRPVASDNERLLKRFEIPDWTDVLTAHVDVGEHYFNYEVVAFSVDAKASAVVDFGIWPEQYYPVTTKKNFRRDLQEVYKDGDKYDKLRDATVDCLRAIIERRYVTTDGAEYDVNLPTPFLQNARSVDGARRPFRRLTIGVDCGDGETAPAIWEGIAAFHRIDDGRYYARAIPCYGGSATARLIRFYDLKTGEWRRGGNGAASTCDWIENPASRRAELAKFRALIPAALLYDANTYKTRREDAWRTPIERDGATSLFDGEDAEYLGMFSEHQCSEESVKERNLSGQLYKIWEMKKPRTSDNEFLDTDTGARALAHYIGVEAGVGKPKPRNIKWVESAW